MRKVVTGLSVFILLILIGFPYLASAQNDVGSSIEMADSMRSEGKIYVVVLVVVIVFSGLAIYAFNTDRKLSKIEKEIKSLKSNQDS